MSGNDLRKRNPLRNMQLALGTAGAMASAAMMSTSFAFAAPPASTAADGVTDALTTVFDIGNNVAGAFSSGLQKIVVPIGIAVFVYFLVRMLLASDPKDVQMYKKRLIMTAIIVFVAAIVPGLIKISSGIGNTVNDELNNAAMSMSGGQ